MVFEMALLDIATAFNTGKTYISNQWDNASKLVSNNDSCFTSLAENFGIGSQKASNKNTNTSVAKDYVENLQSTFQRLKAQQKDDLRVSLRCAPITSASSGDTSILDRLEYVLGSKSSRVNGSTILDNCNNVVKKDEGTLLYGFLYEALAPTVGLVFPYTPVVGFNYTVNYDTTALFQSNLAIQHYTSSPPPTIELSAKFTADTKENAKYMLAAIYFLKAVTKCDFGYQATAGGKRLPGMPPPILYLNGYGDYIMNQIPVVIKSFSYSFPDDIDYTTVMFNLKNAVKFVDYFSDAGLSDSVVSNSSSIYVMKNMLPLQLDVKISLIIQPNIYNQIHQFDLNAYKQGILQFKANPVKDTSAPQYTLTNAYGKSGWTW